MFNGFKEDYEKILGIILENVLQQGSPDFIAINKNSGKLISIDITGLYQNSELAQIQHWWQEGREGFLEETISRQMNNITKCSKRKRKNLLNTIICNLYG